jgi:hypothetical protein
MKRNKVERSIEVLVTDHMFEVRGELSPRTSNMWSVTRTSILLSTLFLFISGATANPLSSNSGNEEEQG